MEKCVNTIAIEKVYEKTDKIQQSLEKLFDALSDLRNCLCIPSLSGGIIDISAYFNNSIYDWDYPERTIQRDGCFITFPYSFRCETKRVLISLVSIDSEEFQQELISLSGSKYGYEVHPEGFIIEDFKLPVIVVNGERYMIE